MKTKKNLTQKDRSGIINSNAKPTGRKVDTSSLGLKILSLKKRVRANEYFKIAH